jgi:hypothetical protein
MGIDDLLDGLARELGLTGEDEAQRLVARWFETGEALTGPAPLPPEPVQAVEAAGPDEAAVYTRTAQLQMLWLVIAGAQAEWEEAEAAGDIEAQAALLKALSVLRAVTDDEDAAVHAALKLRLN